MFQLLHVIIHLVPSINSDLDDKLVRLALDGIVFRREKNTCSRPVDKQSRPFQARKKKKERKLEFLTFNKKKTFIADVVLLWLRFLHHWTPFIPDTFYSWLCLVN